MALQPNYPSTLASGTSGRRRRRPLRTILLVLLAVAVLVPASAGAYLYSLGQVFDSQSTTLDNPFPAESTRPQRQQAGGDPQAAAGGAAAGGPGARPAAAGSQQDGAESGTGGGLNILVMGSDSRGATADEALSGGNSNQRADTLMLVHIPADRTRIYSISLMRDLWIDIPGHGRAKINAALAYGGVPLMVQTVESLFNQRIDHVAMIDFEGFVGMTDALGGVEVNVTQPFVSLHDNFTFNAGPQTLDGERALEFVRERYAYADGDYQRVRNQQAFVKALFAKNLSAETLLNPVKVHNVISSMAPFISVDSGLDAAALARLALELREVRAGDMVMFTLPTLGTGTSADGQSIVLPDYSSVAGISQALAGDSLDNFVASRGLAGGH
ncbi:LytR family transcriptional regulator [Pseudarthrobacter phenanthrenivorans]|uniref:LCP family protein n=1 Tax=Pseudarthrobacter phenanthrenivorans TaxID=361575 RepID=UPI00112AEA90|nr:LCP family protein [Pseudarthrobacter phenanthrenivorans]TPV52484.1 LytR family transcriptional regulator [Pseudarthrobacter phenanthrenivorans]